MGDILQSEVDLSAILPWEKDVQDVFYYEN